MEQGIALLDRLTHGWDPTGQPEGTIAVLARLVRDDPARAGKMVAASPDPAHRLEWLEPLVRWFALPAPAAPIVDGLLAISELDHVSLAKLMIQSRDRVRFDRAFALVAALPPLALATDLAANVAQLRSAGFHDDADAFRDRVLAALPERVPRDEIAPRDLFEALSAPGQPPLVPWLPDQE
jgi:hypothetical protein